MSTLTDSQLKDIAQQQATHGPQIGETWAHFKGGTYAIIARSLMEDTLEPLVTYFSWEKKTCWTRTLKTFEEIVEYGPVGFAPRFRRVEESPAPRTLGYLHGQTMEGTS